ncbi:hypothetical protein GCM10027265_07070 [Jatrophihabitans fulvus]
MADATVGFDSVVHMPNGGTFTMGAQSVMVAAGLPSIITREVGSAFNVDGATPNEHVIIAVVVTFCGMGRYYRSRPSMSRPGDDPPVSASSP